MKFKLVIVIFLGSLSAFANSATCIFQSKTKNFGGLFIPNKINVTEVSKPMLKYEFSLAGNKGKTKKCEVPHTEAANILDTPKTAGWFRYAYGPHELDECLDAYVETPKIRKNKPWKINLISQDNGGETATFLCKKKPKFTDEK